MFTTRAPGVRHWLAGLTCALWLSACQEPPRGEPVEPVAPAPAPPTEPACQGPQDPGRTTLRRLNRSEYDRTVRDLLGDTSHPARDFPVDDHGHGFDNNADVLSMGPLLLEKYAAAAERLVEEAWARGSVPVCALEGEGEGEGEGWQGCARQVLERFARRAFRRPASSEEVEGLLGLVRLAVQEGDAPEVGVRLALRAVLLSPHFLYRVETDPEPESLSPHPLSGYELASRLSYFLWSSMPDEELLAAAEAGLLQSPDALERQARRMLADPKAQALVEDFAGQWLHTRVLEGEPEALEQRFPGLDEPLRLALRQETQALFRELLEGDHPVRRLLDADFTYVNDRLAEHYGLPRPGSEALQRVSLAGLPERWGLLGKGSFLAATSHPDHTSPVRRGVWVLEQLLCRAPPPPPPEINDSLPPGVSPNASTRERLAQHRSDPSCSGCHLLMDPIGLGLENFDATGRWRTEEWPGGPPVDPSGTLPGGQSFSGVVELRELLAANPELTPCVARKLLAWALGRGPALTDECALQAIVHEAEARGGRLSDLVVSLVRSPLFTWRRGGPKPQEAP